MFADLNRTIAALVKAGLPASVSQQVSISFATPDETFPPSSLALPAINFFLFEIHENTEFRSFEPLAERRSDGTVATSPPPVHVDCHYIVTAVSEKQAGAEQDEYEILGAALPVLLRHRVLPPALLRGSLVGGPSPVRAMTAHKGSTGIELWQALKGKPRACLHYTLTVPVVAAAPQSAGEPVRVLDVGGPP